MNDLLVGGIATGSLVAALFFLRFRRATHDRFFLLFALSFALEGINRVLLWVFVGPNEDAPVYYLIRLVAYGLILAAIVQKNRRNPRRDDARPGP
jgi:uncharacterized membrane protein HdeD (DUF308 family)